MRPPTMLTTDLSLRLDPDYEPISRRFHENPDELADAFARAWFKLTHRDMGPIERYLGPEVPDGGAALAGPDPRGDARARRRGGRRGPQGADPRLGPVGVRSWSRPRGRRRRRSAAATSAAARTARASAWSRRRLGGQRPGRAGEGARARSRASRRRSRRANGSGKQVSLADLIVLGGCAAVEQAAKDGGVDVEVPFTPGRADASEEQTDADSFDALEPTADGFRNYLAADHRLTAEYLLVDRANLLTLSAPEMTVLVGGLRVLGANAGGSSAGVLTETPGIADERLLREPARPGHDVVGDGRRRRASSRPATAPARSSGPAPASTSCSARTPSCARSPRSTRATTRARSSCTTSSPRGTRS